MISEKEFEESIVDPNTLKFYENFMNALVKTIKKTMPSKKKRRNTHRSRGGRGSVHSK